MVEKTPINLSMDNFSECDKSLKNLMVRFPSAGEAPDTRMNKIKKGQRQRRGGTRSDFKRLDEPPDVSLICCVSA